MDPEQFPSNSRRPTRPQQDEPKRVPQVVQGPVVRRKTPLTRRFLQNITGGEGKGVVSYMFEDILAPAFRDMVADTLIGGVQQALGQSGPRRGHVRYGNPAPHTPYQRYSQPDRGRRDEPRRELSRRGRARHDFDEIVLASRAEADEILIQMDGLADRYDAVSVADLYRMLGIQDTFADEKWGWVKEDLRHASASRVSGGYLLNLPRPEPLD